MTIRVTATQLADLSRGAAAQDSGTCHCAAKMNGSGHCPACHCEEYETYCDYRYEPPASGTCGMCWHLLSLHRPDGCTAKVYPADSLQGELCGCEQTAGACSGAAGIRFADGGPASQYSAYLETQAGTDQAARFPG